MPVIAITPGEPAGIGPDLLIRLAQHPRIQAWVAICDRNMLQSRAEQLGLALHVDANVAEPARRAGLLSVMHTPLAQQVVPGVLNPANAEGVLAALDKGISGCMDGTFAGLVTGPVQKSVINEAGQPFSGHTEYLAQHAGVEDVVMLLVADELRVGLATTHMPLREVADAITAELLTRRIGILHRGLVARFGLSRPRILVAGLNPHAGEGGHLGEEEIRIITPVCTQLRKQGLDVVGPLPADTLFTREKLETADAVFAMYHDQGLPVLKHRGFGHAVNVTLGLPFVRTSVDHGTALDLAGSGHGDVGSLAAALQLCGQMAAAVQT